MDKQYTVLLGEMMSKTGTNSDVNLVFDVTDNRRILHEDVLIGKIDEYEQYIKEKDACTKFNMIFTVNVVASNVLFNRVSEIVYHEGADDCIFFGRNGVRKKPSQELPLVITNYNDYKMGNNTGYGTNNLPTIILVSQRYVILSSYGRGSVTMGTISYGFERGIADIDIYVDDDASWLTVTDLGNFTIEWRVSTSWVETNQDTRIGRIVIRGNNGLEDCYAYIVVIQRRNADVDYLYFSASTINCEYGGVTDGSAQIEAKLRGDTDSVVFVEIGNEEENASWASGTKNGDVFNYTVEENDDSNEREGYFQFTKGTQIVGRLYVRQGGKSEDGETPTDTTFLTRYKLLRDTAYSHKDIGGVVYHCGYDIFGNHMLRKAGFSIINKLYDTENNPKMRINFNTLSDYSRDINGNVIKDNVSTIRKSGNGNGSRSSGSRSSNGNGGTGSNGNGGRMTNLLVNTNVSDTHQYFYDSILSINDTIRGRLVEKNGWFGFINPSGMDIKNYGEISINKCMNNNKACEQIDMYPDRSLFTMTPKYNKYRNRVENNWDYCLTFPYKNFYDHELVTSNRIKDKKTGKYVNGLECTLITRAASLLFNLTGDFELEYKDNAEILFSTNVNHNLNVGDTIRMWVKYSGETYELETNVLYVGLGGDYPNYFFTINSSAFEHIFSEVKTKEGADENTYNIALPKEGVIDYGDDNDYDIENGFINWNNDEDEIRFAKLVKGRPCDYYLRLFKKVPNFKNTSAYTDGVITEEEIEEYSSNKFNSSLNNLAFSNNIYGDPIAQIIFNDDIEINGLKDNLGRDISELYLTIIKRNEGYKKWYGLNSDNTKNYWDEDIEYSHCFGKITAGFDVMPYVGDYNVHRIHNVDLDKFDNLEKFANINPSDKYVTGAIKNYYKILTNFQESAKCLEEGSDDEITIYGDTSLRTKFGNNIFFGDIVEFSLYDVEETVLEDANFRFNTVQREYTNDSEFYNFIYEEITEDDYKLFDLTRGATVDKSPFKTSAVTYNVSNTIYTYVKDRNGKNIFNLNYPFNLAPEGYYYAPHTRVPVREYSSVVKQGSHTEIIFSPATAPVFDCDGNEIKGRWKTMDWDDAIKIGSTDTFNIIAAKNYYMNVGDKLLLFEKGYDNKEPIVGRVVGVEGKTFNYLTVKFDEDVILYAPDDITEYTETFNEGLDDEETETFNANRTIRKVGRIKYKLFKYNVEKPANALELNDGTGNYLWRPFLSESALTQDDELYNRPYTNGRIYVHKFVDLFLRRQDPYNDYGLNCDDCATKLSNLTIYGEYKDVTQYDSEEPVESKLCASIIGDMMTNVGEQLETMSKSRISNFNIDKVVDSYRDKRKAKKERDAAAQQQNAQNQG